MVQIKPIIYCVISISVRYCVSINYRLLFLVCVLIKQSSQFVVIFLCRLPPMKIEEREVPSSSGVSDGDEEEEDDEPNNSPAASLNKNSESTAPGLKNVFTGSFAGNSDLTSINIINCESENEPSSKTDNCSLSNSINDVSCSKPLVTADIKNSYVFVTKDGQCAFTDVHQTSSTVHVCGNGVQVRDVPIGYQNSSSLNYSRGRSSTTVAASICKGNSDNKLDRPSYHQPCESSDESEDDRERPSDDQYEGSEENEDDEFLRSGIYDNSRFNHYQKLLKEHEFVEGGDEEEYLRFLYHRHLYYNQLQKISPTNMQLFRRLEEMQSVRFTSSGRNMHSNVNENNSNTYFDSPIHRNPDSFFRKANRRPRLPDPFPINRFSRSRSSSRFQLQSKYSRQYGGAHHSPSKSRSSCSTSAFTHLDNFLTIPFLLLAFLSFLLVVESVGGCRLSEFTCSSYDCIKADEYCDGETDCPDRSDEPRDCSREYPMH